MTPPRLREAHAHLPWHGLALSMPRLNDCATLDDCLSRIAAEADRRRREQEPGWLRASGLMVAAWTGPAGPRPPTRAEFDRVCDTPAVLMSFDHHAVVANTAAMQAAGLRDDSPDPPGGVIVRDPRTALPTGLLLEAAAQLVWNAAPQPTPDQHRANLRAALHDLARHGFTEVHDLLAPDWLGPELAALADADALALEVHLFAPLERLEHQAAAAAGLPGQRGWARPNVRLAGGKIFADGTLNSRTAWMLDPYRDPLPGLPRGKALLQAPAIAEALQRCGALDLTLAVHAIGDAAVRACLDAYGLFTAEARASHPDSPGARASRPRSSIPLLRIEHAELIDPADIPRFASPGIVASLQPCHLLADIPALQRSLPHRLDRVLPIRDLIDAGCEPGRTLIFGSDVPVVPPDPRHSVEAAVHRGPAPLAGGASSVPSPASSAPLAPRQAIDEATAWACFRPD